MNAELLFTGDEGAHRISAGSNAVVVDVLRATTVVVSALENGASAVIPCVTIDEALRLAEGRRADVVLGGEREARKIAGFDCGNSPFEYLPERVAGKEVILATTNGTKAIRRADGADGLFVLCARNAGAVASRAAREGKDLAVVCSGTDGRFSADDALCAGIFLDRLCEITDARLDDAGRFVRDFYRMSRALGVPIAQSLAESLHLRRLAARGFAADLEFCLEIDATDAVPVLLDGKLVLP